MELQDRGNVSLRFNLKASLIWEKGGKGGEKVDMKRFYILLILEISFRRKLLIRIS